MFWDKGYTPSQNIEHLLEKENVTVEEFLEDEDILQECKSLKKPIMNYFTRADVIKRLVELVTTEPADDLAMTLRFRHANMACEILSLGLPSLNEKLLADADTLKLLYSYLEREPPLNSLLSSFFSKTFSMLFMKTPQQDWFSYQQMCLQLLEFIKSQNNFLELICKHFTTPIIPELIMQMMRDLEGGALKRNLYEWLTEDGLVERLIAILNNPLEDAKHANVAEFLCDLIQQGRSMRQTEYENDSFELAFNGSNPILKRIESEATIEALLNVILNPKAKESSIVSGICVVLTLIKPIVFAEEATKFIHNREKDIHEQILVTVIRVITPCLKDFNQILSNPPNKAEFMTTAAKLSPPFGMIRLQVCRLFTVLLQTRNEEVAKAICTTDFFETLLSLFKQYCWNNFLHTEVEKCLHLVFYTEAVTANNSNSTQGSTVVNDGSFGKTGTNTTSLFEIIFQSFMDGGNGDVKTEAEAESNKMEIEEHEDKELENKVDSIADKVESEDDTNVAKMPEAEESSNNIDSNKELNDEQKMPEKPDNVVAEQKIEENTEANTTAAKDETTATSEKMELDEECLDNTKNATTDFGPSALQTHVIANSKIISKLIDCWQYNTTMQCAEKGRRLGYMGHLIKIFKHISNSISESEHIGALIETNLSDAAELELWQSIMNSGDGALSKALNTQSKMLANCNAHDEGEYGQDLPKDFLGDTISWDYIMNTNVLNDIQTFGDSIVNLGQNLDEDEEDDDENNIPSLGEGHHLLFSSRNASAAATTANEIGTFGVTSNPWDNVDPFSELNNVESSSSSSTAETTAAAAAAAPWASSFNTDNFADFDAHFSSFSNDLGESLSAAIKDNNSTTLPNVFELEEKDIENKLLNTDLNLVEWANAKDIDNNANVEAEVEASMSAARNVNHVEQNIKTKETQNLVQNLNTLMQDFEDDYEDDGGMWTKPLGAAVPSDDDETAVAADDAAADAISEEETIKLQLHEVISEMVIPNGPLKQRNNSPSPSPPPCNAAENVAPKDNKEVACDIDDAHVLATTTNITNAKDISQNENEIVINSKTMNATAAEQILNSVISADIVEQQQQEQHISTKLIETFDTKRTNATTTTKTIENATT